jgi:hypothetical protein
MPDSLAVKCAACGETSSITPPANKDHTERRTYVDDKYEDDPRVDYVVVWQCPVPNKDGEPCHAQNELVFETEDAAPEDEEQA